MFQNMVIWIRAVGNEASSKDGVSFKSQACGDTTISGFYCNSKLVKHVALRYTTNHRSAYFVLFTTEKKTVFIEV